MGSSPSVRTCASNSARPYDSTTAPAQAGSVSRAIVSAASFVGARRWRRSVVGSLLSHTELSTAADAVSRSDARKTSVVAAAEDPAKMARRSFIVIGCPSTDLNASAQPPKN